MAEAILRNIYRIKVRLPNSPLKLLNSYYIRNPGGRGLLIDTGFNHPDCRACLLAGLEELDVNMAETDVLLTHLHSDHTGLAPEIAVPGTRVYIGRGEIPWLYGQTRIDLWAADAAGLLRQGFSAEAVAESVQDAASRSMSPDIGFSAYLPIDAGDSFVCGDYTLEAVETPGHTPAHMCFRIESEKLMFTGDHVLFDITPNITNWVNADDSLGDYLDSLRKTARYDVKIALPGHREPGDYRARIKALLAHHEQRLAECFSIVKENPGFSAYDIAGKMTWSIRCNSWEDFPINQKWFAVGECQSHLRRLEKQGRIIASDDRVIRYRVKERRG
ncbi:MAG: MBL fold metallo-hydrolase [Oscillospiraceae bacterium]|nr:MBL fold metallo-hydrolase [Oscillospiraceae bacterium]